MSVSNIVINDAAGTPVAHTFVPITRDANGVLWWEDQSTGGVLGYDRISLSVVRPPAPSAGSNAGERNFKVTVAVYTPTLETLGTSDSGITPPDQVAYVLKSQTTSLISERSTLRERQDSRKYAYQLLDESQVKAAFETLVVPFG